MTENHELSWNFLTEVELVRGIDHMELFYLPDQVRKSVDYNWKCLSRRN